MAYPHGQPNAPTTRSEPPAPDLLLLKRYQRVMLYGGGIVLSLLMIAAYALGIEASVHDYLAGQHNAFLVNRSLLRMEMETEQALFSRTVAAAELLWSEHRRAGKHELAEFAQSKGRRIVQKHRDATAQLALAQLDRRDAAPDQDSYAYYLGLTAEMGNVFGAAERQVGRPGIGIFYNPDRTFVSMAPARLSGDVLGTPGQHSVADVIERLVPRASTFEANSIDDAVSGVLPTYWSSPLPNPFGAGHVLHLSQPAHYEGEVFAIFVRQVSIERLRAMLRQSPAPGEFLVLDRQGDVVLHSEGDPSRADTALAIRALKVGAARPRKRNRVADAYRGGVFSISDRIPGTDWTLNYIWSWRTMAAALAPKAAVWTGGVASLLALLWTLLLVFNHKVFRPVYRRSQRVYESEHLNRSILSTAPVGIGLISIARREVIFENEPMHAYRHAAHGGGRRITQPLLDAYRMHCATFGSDKIVVPLNLDLSVVTENGTTRNLLASIVTARVHGEDAILCILSDITVRKLAEYAATEARRLAEEANTAKTMFVAAVSHELRTPLNAMLGHLELLRRHWPSLDDAGRLAVVETSAQHLLDVISDILDVSKIESGRMQLESIAFSPARLVHQVSRLFAPLAASKGIALEVEIGAAVDSACMGDALRVRQILVNLVSNAIKFTERGQVRIRVDMSHGVSDTGTVHLVVEDTGIGMTPEQQARIFDSFAQADESISRRFGGTGLGLTLCRKLAELMDGTITVSSEPSAGSRFIVQLPLPATLAAPVVDICTVPPDIPFDVHPRQVEIRVLAVDDQELNRALIADQLAELGYDADVVSNARDAIRAFIEHDYDVVLTDLSMAGMDGFALAQCLTDIDPRVPVIAYTANTSDTDAHNCRECGMSDVLHKPATLAMIDAAVRRNLRLPQTMHEMPALSDGALGEHHFEVLWRTTLENFDDARRAITAGNPARLLDILHALRGAWAMAREPAIADAIGDMEMRCRQHGVEGALAALDTLWSSIDAAIRCRESAMAQPVPIAVDSN
ncbi:ATP-binding protein [Burkholderia sp. 22PA0099]|uniref:hybrid sensor histidine kinase/response regulator n=1 Tax=Burkholderia sp. 22PA0099 TaxID=3237372 RepID=UPI0039C4705E